MSRKNQQRIIWALLFSAICRFSAVELSQKNVGSPVCKGVDFDCKYCDNLELDCSGRGLFDGMLTSPKFALANFIPNNTEKINLSKNNLIYLSVDYSPMWLNSLKQLLFSHNSIEAIYKDTFKGLLHIEILDLSYNNIRFLQSDVFKHLGSLQTLDLSHNFLPGIDGLWFQQTKALIRLNLSYNQLGTGSKQ